jgi:hypothetical protein
MRLARAAIATLNLERLKHGLFADAGRLIELPGSAERKTGTATRERPTQVTSGHNEYPGLEFGMSRSSSHGLGKYSASHALRHRWRVAAGCAADPFAPAPGRYPPHTKPKLVAPIRLYQALGWLGFDGRLQSDADNLACVVLCLRRRLHSRACADKSCARERVSARHLVMERVVEAVTHAYIGKWNRFRSGFHPLLNTYLIHT